MIEYKGYLGRVEFDPEAHIFHGEILNTRDVITFQGASVAELEQAFHASIDDYLAFCAERGEEPEKPFSGQFLARIPVELHRRIHAAAADSGLSLNAWVKERLEEAVAQPHKVQKRGYRESHARPGKGGRPASPEQAGKTEGRRR